MNLRFTNPPPPLPPLTRCALSGSRFRDEEGSLALIERGAKRFSLNLRTQSMIDSLKCVARGVLLAVRVLGFPIKKEKPSSERKTSPSLSLSLSLWLLFLLFASQASLRVPACERHRHTTEKQFKTHTVTHSHSFFLPSKRTHREGKEEEEEGTEEEAHFCSHEEREFVL